MRIEYVLKRPGKEKGRRARTFTILKRVTLPGHKPVSKKLLSESLDAVNKAFLEGTIDFNYANHQAEEIRAKLYADAGRKLVVHNPHNLALLDKYWQTVYIDGARDIKDFKSEEAALRRATTALGNVSLLSEQVNLIQKAVLADVKSDPRKFNRRIQKLNQLRKYYGITLPLNRRKDDPIEPKFLTVTELTAVIGRIKSPTIKILCWIGFTTGMRFGEIFATPPNEIVEDGLLYITKQIDPSGRLTSTKNRKPRKAPIFKEGDAYIEAWMQVDEAKKIELRKSLETRISKVFMTACCKEFPTRPSKHLTFHALRHSYAKRLFEKKQHLSTVADCLGDDERTAKRYYLGWIQTDDLLNDITARVRG